MHCSGRVGSQTTADRADLRGERMTFDEADFNTGHATTERYADYRQSNGMRPYLGIRVADCAGCPRWIWMQTHVGQRILLKVGSVPKRPPTPPIRAANA